MPTKHRVAPGETLASIAKRHGYLDWDKIYSHPNNADFRSKRPNPHVINPGDLLVIPEPEPRIETAAVEAKHRYRVLDKTQKLRIKLRESDGQALANEPYTLTIGKKIYQGATGGDGMLEEPLEADSSQGTIELPDRGLMMPLRIGHLDPVSDADTKHTVTTGVQARLNNLGFFCGAIDGHHGEATKAAIIAFQRQVMSNEQPDGALDPQTLDTLIREHGC